MKRRLLIALCLLMMLVVLTGCSSDKPGKNQQIFAEATQYLGPVTVTDTPAPVVVEPQDEPSVFDENPYDVDFTAEDALAEENLVDPFAEEGYGEDPYAAYAQPEGTVYPYAGSTPIPLLPVDMPSPTPRGPLTFSYASYTSGSLGITFEAPSGWLVDDSLSDVFVLTEPETEMHDGYQCTLTFYAVPVNTNYDEGDLKKEVSQRLKSIGSLNFVEWKPSTVDKRHLMGANGYYGNYSGTLANGVDVGGRIHYACKDGKLYGVEVSYPLAYKDDYMEVFYHIRDTIAPR
ncbi:MAG: hypothetical protein E7331_02025 [Clostridiales bacterium]|nr:hypothetical protein [Clostridiales bacterium]